MLTSFTKGITMSGPFDIQYRLYNPNRDDTIEGGRLYIHSIDSLILRNDIEIVEGLIFDTINGGVGYRNHTIPIGMKYSATWSEDLLWIEPVTECVDTNLALHFTLPNRPEIEPTNKYIRDNGGLAIWQENTLIVVSGNTSTGFLTSCPRIQSRMDQQRPGDGFSGYNGSWPSRKFQELYCPATVPF